MSVSLNTPVGEFFVLREFVQRGTSRVGPYSAAVSTARLCCRVLDPVRRRFGETIITSGYRSREYNEAIGGASQSRHIWDEHDLTPAVDFRCATGSPRQWYDFVDGLLGNTGGLGLYSTHVHVDRRPEEARWTG